MRETQSCNKLGIRAQQTPDHHDVINAPGVYLILVVQAGAFNR